MAVGRDLLTSEYKSPSGLNLNEMQEKPKNLRELQKFELAFTVETVELSSANNL